CELLRLCARPAPAALRLHSLSLPGALRFSGFVYARGGRMPMTSVLAPSISTSEPSTSSRPPKCACQPSYVRIATTCSARSPKSRSEEHTSELQSREKIVCRLLPEKKKQGNR